MKVLHIAATDIAGAGKGMLNQHMALLDLGVESKVLVANKGTSLDTVFVTKPNLFYHHYVVDLLFRGLRRVGICISPFYKFSHKIQQIHSKHKVFFTSPFSQYDLSTHPLVQEADVINIHWVAGFLDYPSFLKKVNKPIVFTMRDENLGLGGFHYSNDRDQWFTYYKELEEEFLKIKREALLHCHKLYIVSLSQIMINFCKNSEFLSKLPNRKIYNLISPNEFKLSRHQEAKQQQGFKNDDFVITFVSVNIDEKRKGLTKVIDAIEKVDNPHIKLLCVGNGTIENLNSRIVLVGPVKDSEDLSKIYSASNVFISASVQESFGKTVVEAMYCGCPVISTPAGIAQEIINEDNGIVCPNGTVEEFVEAIEYVMTHNYDRNKISADAVKLFAPQTIAKQYYDLYKEIIAK